MKPIPTLALAAAFAVTAAGAQTLTREQVKAELNDALRSGNVVAAGQLGLKENEIHPELYQARAEKASKSRAQVRGELTQAQREGTLSWGQAGMTQREARPDLYPTQTASLKTRAEVKAELADAIRHGDLVAGTTGMTYRELNPQRYADVKAGTTNGNP